MANDTLNLIELTGAPGEHRGMLQSSELELELEACFVVPENPSSEYIALLGHPHSLKGGSMQNKVVTTLARTFRERGIPSVRFNFRGVGASGGEFDSGIAESEDMLAVAQQVQEVFPGRTLLFAGFSFGGFVVYRAAAQIAHGLLLTVAPPVNHFDFTSFSPEPRPWLCVQGDDDEVIPSELVLEFAKKHRIPVLEFSETGHFFHGKLAELKERLLNALDDILA